VAISPSRSRHEVVNNKPKSQQKQIFLLSRLILIPTDLRRVNAIVLKLETPSKQCHGGSTQYTFFCKQYTASTVVQFLAFVSSLAT
jgi:hypothetical protein